MKKIPHKEHFRVWTQSLRQDADDEGVKSFAELLKRDGFIDVNMLQELKFYN